MPCFSKTKLVPEVKTSGSALTKPNNVKNNAKNMINCKKSVENPKFSASIIPEPIREQCLDIMEARGYTTDPARRILTQPAQPPPAKGVRVKHPKYILKAEMERLQNEAKVESVEERVAKVLKEEDYKITMNEIAIKAKEHFREIDEARRKKIAKEGDKATGGDAALAEKNKVLDRVFIARYEQEQEIKDVNRVIMNTKCSAIRDAQLLEKTIIEKKMKEEKTRLEKAVMESSGLDNDEENAIKDKQKKAMYRAQITAQLRERENLRFLESQRLEEEARMIRLADEAYKKEEEKEKLIACERRRRLMEDYTKVLEMTQLFKKMLCEQEQESEMRIAAYLKEKREREKQLAEEKRQLRIAFERKQQTIFMLAQKALESKSQQTEMNLLREQERAEREYRRKEKEAALNKIRYEKEIAANREKQMQENKHRRALQIARAEEEFNAMLERIRQDQLKEEENERKRKCRRECYRQAIMLQMADKEMERRRLEELNRQDAFQFLEAERQREANIKAVINTKLEAMKQACLPEKYIKEVEAQLCKLEKARKKVK